MLHRLRLGWLIRDSYRGAWRDVLCNYGWFLAGFAGIVVVWLFVEWVVILSPLAGNRTAWWTMHVAYFFPVLTRNCKEPEETRDC
jgi:hypothetical protein